MKKLVFLDIDGTILPEGKTEVDSDVIDAIKRVEEAGNIVFISTGRNSNSAKSVIDQIGINNYVTSNGQKIVINGEVVFNHHIQRKEVDETMKRIQKHTSMFAVEDDFGLKTNSTKEGQELAELIKGHGFVHVDATDDYDLSKVYQMWAFGTKEQLDGLVNDINDIVDCYRWTENALEIATKDYGKGMGVTQVVNILGEDVKTYGFGDGVNDISMMQTVDVAVAMENANEDLKIHCHEVIGSCENKGLINGFDKLGLYK